MPTHLVLDESNYLAIWSRHSSPLHYGTIDMEFRKCA